MELNRRRRGFLSILLSIIMIFSMMPEMGNSALAQTAALGWDDLSEGMILPSGTTIDFSDMTSVNLQAMVLSNEAFTGTYPDLRSFDADEDGDPQTPDTKCTLDSATIETDNEGFDYIEAYGVKYYPSAYDFEKHKYVRTEKWVVDSLVTNYCGNEVKNLNLKGYIPKMSIEADDAVLDTQNSSGENYVFDWTVFVNMDHALSPAGKMLYFESSSSYMKLYGDGVTVKKYVREGEKEVAVGEPQLFSFELLEAGSNRFRMNTTDEASYGYEISFKTVAEYPNDDNIDTFVGCFSTSDGAYVDAKALIPIHRHSFTYSASGAVITATCSAEDCGLENNQITLTLNAPEKTAYSDNKSALATVSGVDDFSDVVGFDVVSDNIEYVGRDGTQYEKSAKAPTGIGKYTAEFTLAVPDEENDTFVDYKASVDYEIAKDPQDAPSAIDAANVTVTKNSVTLPSQEGYEYSKDGVNWQSGNVFNGLDSNTKYTFYQRKAGTQTNAPSPASLGTDITTYATATVTFKVVNGMWSNEKTEDVVVNLEAPAAQLSLATVDIPVAGYNPSSGYRTGRWDTTPSTDTVFVAGSSTVYTYTYGSCATIEVKVEKIFNGRAWTEGDSFEFSISPEGKTPSFENNVVSVTSSSVNHIESFGTVIVSDPGTYSWIVSETHKGETINDIDYAADDCIATVVVTADANGNLIAAEGSSLTQTVQFTNQFNAYCSLSVVASNITSSNYGSGDYVYSTVTISNNGNIAAGISSVAITGTDKECFSLSLLDGYSAPASIDVAGSFAGYIVTPVAGLNAGTYNALVTVTYDNDATASAAISFTVNKGTPTAGMFTYSSPASLEYNTQDKAAGVSAVTGITGMGDISVLYFSDEARTKQVSETKNVSTYYVGITVTQGDNFNATGENQVLYGDGWSFTLTKAEPSVSSADFGSVSTQYGKTLADITLPTSENGTWSWVLPDSAETASDVSVGNAGTGSFTALFTPSDDRNYTTKTVTVSISVAKAVITIKAKDHTIVYGQAPENDGSEYSGLVNGDTSDVINGTTSYTYSYEQYGDVGEYTITPAGLFADNYDFDYQNGTLTVEAAKLTFGWTGTSFSYDGLEKTVSATAVTANDDVLSLTVSNASATNVGDYIATVTAVGGDKAGNYAFDALADSASHAWSIVASDMSYTAPSAPENPLVYTGGNQQLLIPGSTQDGSFLYALSSSASTAPESDSYGPSVPVGKNTGDYFVWYLPTPDGNHKTESAVCIKVTISPVDKTELKAAILEAQAYSGSIESYVTIKNKLDAAISSANGIVNDNNKTQAEVAAATDALKNALNTARAELAAADKAAADKAAADTVKNLIDALPAPTDVTTGDETAITAARAALDKLEPDQKLLIDGETVGHLTDDEAALASAKDKAAKDKAAADAVKKLIDALPQPAKVRVGDEDAITSARTAYDFLSGDQKKLIDSDTLGHLTDDEAALERAKKAASEAEKAAATYHFESSVSEYTKNSGINVEFIIKSEEAQDGSFKRFVRIRIGDREIILPTEGVVTEGSTVINIKAAFLDTLDTGDHTITVEFTNGSISTGLKILDAPKKEDTPATTTGSASAALLMIMFFAAGAVLVYRKRRA